MYVYSKSVFDTQHIELNTYLKKSPSDKINGTKDALFFLSRAPTHLSFLLNCDFYMSLNIRFGSLKLCVGFSTFNSVPSLSKFIFLFNKMHEFFDFKTS